MLGDPNVFLLGFVVVGYIAVRVLALYDRLVGSTDGRSDGPDPADPR